LPLWRDKIVVDDRLPIEVADAKQHLRLEIDHGNHAIVWG
jgi:hypothetical protein